MVCGGRQERGCAWGLNFSCDKAEMTSNLFNLSNARDKGTKPGIGISSFTKARRSNSLRHTKNSKCLVRCQHNTIALRIWDDC